MAVVVVKDTSKSMASLISTAMLMINVNRILVVGYGLVGDIGSSSLFAEGDEWYRPWLSLLRNVGGGGALYIPGGELGARSFFFQSPCSSQFP